MGFGRGILENPRRTPRPLEFEGAIPFGRVVSNQPGARNAVVLTPHPGYFPALAISARGPFVRSDFLRRGGTQHDKDAFGLVPPRGASSLPKRDLISDARDLLVGTLFKRTEIPGDPGRSPTLECRVEDPSMWSNPPTSQPVNQEPSRFIHIGRTSRVESFLELLHTTPRVQEIHQTQTWQGLSSLDRDGFVVATFASFEEHHLILVGGSDYGTYYAVAWFLWHFARVRWLFPGDLGTVIPKGDLANGSALDLGAFYYVDEPDYRGRTFTAMVDASGTNHTAEETNAMRNWLLRNRMHPSVERATLFVQRPRERNTAALVVDPQGSASPSEEPTDPENPANRLCWSLSPDKRKFLGEEARIPVGHGLSRFFPPSTPSFDPVQLNARVAQRGDVPDLYPDVRPRVSGATPLNSRPATAGQVSPAVVPSGYVFSSTRANCNPDPVPRLPPVPPGCYCGLSDFSTDIALCG